MRSDEGYVCPFFWEWVPRKSSMALPHDPVIPLLGTISQRIENKDSNKCVYFLLQLSGTVASACKRSEVCSWSFRQNEALRIESNLPSVCKPSILSARNNGLALWKARAQCVWSVFNSSPLPHVYKSWNSNLVGEDSVNLLGDHWSSVNIKKKKQKT